MSNLLENHVFIGGLNSDDSEFLIPKTDYRNAINARILGTVNGKLGSLQNVKGNEQVGTDINTLSRKSGTFQTIGAYEDEKDRCIYAFHWNSEGYHLITKQDESGTTILLDNDRFLESGAMNGLNFSKDKPITGVDMVGDMLFWTDPVPRRINVKRLLNGEYDSFDDDLISIIRRPPNLPPTWTKVRTGGQGIESLIRDTAFQFAWRFVYDDGETSVFSPYSTLAPYGTEDEIFNAIQITLPSDNAIKQDVRFVELAVRYGNTGNLFIIKRWDKNNTTDGAAIEDHNDGISLSYNFLNDVIGEAVDAATGAKPFESVPLTSKNLVAADNRVFLGNNKSGYETPAPGGMTLSKQSVEVDVGGSIITGVWWRWISVFHTGGDLDRRYAWLLYMEGYNDIEDGWYAVDGYEGSEDYKYSTDELRTNWFDFPAVVNYSDMHLAGKPHPNKHDSWEEIRKYYHNAPNQKVWHLDKITDVPDNTSTVAGAPSNSGFRPKQVFKTRTTYQVGKVFYDRYMRSSAVVTKDSLKVSTDDTGFDNTTYLEKILWTLTNDHAVDEIPEWAEYYSIVITKNLRTRFFMQTFPYEISYVNKTDDGTYETKKDAYSPQYAGIQIDISSLSKDNLGYVFNKGDVVTLYVDGKNPIPVSVIDQYGKYIVCTLVNLGDLTTTPGALIELYTPYKASTIEPFWEIGQMYHIVDPGLSTREYSTLTGAIMGDTWIVARDYSSLSANGVEAMSPNDKHYQDWFTDAGRPNTVPQPGIGQAVKETGVVFSEQYIPQTLINGLCTFDTLNAKNLPDSCGPIRKMVFTSKVQGSLGGVLLAICENETASVYIGQEEVTQQDGSTLLVASGSVMGTVNILRGTFGTINPESVVEKDGNVYFLCLKRGKVVRYAVNGLFPVSDYKMQSFFQQRCADLLALTTDQLAAFGYDSLFCPGGYDMINEEYLISLPRTKALPDFLEDITRQTYKFNLSFGSGGTQTTKATELSKLCFYKGTIETDTAPATITVKYGDQLLIDGVSTDNGIIEIPAFKPDKSKDKFSVTVTAGTITLNINQLQPNYHEVEDHQEIVLSFKEPVNRWTGKYFYRPEWFSCVGNTLYSFLHGNVYKHDVGDYGTFYGEQFPALVAFDSNDNALAPRIFNGMTMDASQVPNYVHLRTEVPWDKGIYYQSTDLIKEDFKIEEGKFYAPFFFDRLSPNAPGDTYEAKMHNGDVMRAQIGNIFVEFGEYNDVIELKKIGINYAPSSGHTV